MKKYILALVMAVSVTAGVAAQDTITINYQQVNPCYLVDNAWKDYKVNYGFRSFGGPTTGGEYAKRFVVDDSVTIYGIAVGVVETGPFTSHYVYDTSYTNSIEYVRLYRSQSDTLACIAQVPIHLRTTPISYYFYVSDCLYCFSAEDRLYSPMYELCFDNPVTVCDSFYAGMTFFIERPYTDSVGTVWEYACRPLSINQITVGEWAVSYKYIISHHHRNTDGTFYKVWGRGVQHQEYMMLFPMLLPDTIGGDTTFVGDSVIVTDTVIVGGDTVAVSDTVYIGDIVVGSDTVAMGDTIVVTDTLVIGGDTIVVTDTILSIMSPDLLQRLTGVTPNPARGTARVVASTGLTMVEAYSLAGRKVHTQRVPQGALAVTLDVSRWPAGTYLLRIHTPLGATIKKLTVTR